MKIAIVYSYDTRDRRTFSGSAYYIARMLEKYCGEIFHLSPIPRFKEMLVGKIINKISLLLLKKKFRYHCSFLLAKRYAKVTAQRLTGQSFDLIVSPVGVVEVAFLETDIPVVLIEDSTFKLLIDYNFDYLNLLRRSMDEMNVIQNLALRKASAVIYSSAWAARSAIEDYGADPAKIHVVPFGANLDEIPPREIVLARKKSGRCRLLFLAVGWARKGGDIAFETLLKLEEMGIAAELIVCGCIPPKTVIHERMTVVPFLDKNDERQRKELEQLLMSADFLLLPTRADCTPIVYCEANAFGIPVITTRTGGVPEIVRDGENGFLLPYEARGAAYAEVIAGVYRDDECYTALVKAGRAAFEERLNWDAWGVAVKHILTELLDRKKSCGDSHVSLVVPGTDKF
jgi:glycosyltransferase involved in cell wall biosynthesis